MLKNAAPTYVEFGSLLKDELKRRGITQKGFAEAFGLKSSNVSGILNGKRKIPVSLIPVVSELLGVEESVIINSQKNFITETKSLESQSEEESKAKAELSEFENLISLKSLLKGLVNVKSTAIERLRILKDYYGLTSPSDLLSQSQSLSESCFRRSDKTGMDHIMISTWVVKVKAAAKRQCLKEEFNHSDMDSLVAAICEVLHKNKNNTPAQVKLLLNAYGIGYIEMPKESKASIDGYSFLLGHTPFIAVTRRFDRIDNYAFNVMHELGHIYYGHVDETGKINVVVTNSESNESFPKQEEEADRFATEKLIPNNVWLLAPTVPMNPYVIQKQYTKWAKSKNLNPWIVLGRVSHETGMYRFTSDTSRNINKGKEGGGS